MSLTFYDNYLKNVAKTPNESWRSSQQEIISSVFTNTTLLEHDMWQESYNRDFTFFHLDECWVGTVMDTLTNATKDSDDFREIYFKDCAYEVPRGTYFKYKNNYWIVYETPSELESISHCKIRRCNNWLKWVDEATGIMYEYPCVIDYTLSSANSQTSKTVIQANSHVDLIVQGNARTIDIVKNSRFLFNGVPYRFYSINNYMQNDYVDQNVQMLYMDFFLDMIDDSDNLQINLANDIRGQYSAHVNLDAIKGINNSKGKIDMYATRTSQTSDIKIDTEFECYAEDSSLVVIDNEGNYQLTGKVGDTTNIVVRIKNNELSSIRIPVEITSDIVEVYSMTINDYFDEIKQGRTKTFSVDIYLNGMFVTNECEVTANWENDKNYILSKNDNNIYSLTNIKYSTEPLVLTFTNDTYGVQEQMNIKLRPML